MACDPRRILDDAAAALQSSAAERGVELETRIERGVPSMVTTDPMRVAQILVNLIAHAVRSSEAGAVRLNVRHESRANGKFLEIDVVDSGLGMSEEQLTKIFQPFSPADSSMRRRFGGTGLGLFISKSLTELLGGSLLASSSPGAGSTFHLSLPLADFTGSFAAKVGH
jgi:signal transduction histidine kinase